jgi:hypothetical protein
MQEDQYLNLFEQKWKIMTSCIKEDTKKIERLGRTLNAIERKEKCN